VTIVGIGMRNVWRNKARAILTIFGGAIAVVAFVVFRTILSSWEAGAEYAAKDRLATRHKVSFIMPMPKRYVETIRQVPGVTGATWFNWFGAKDPNRPDEFFNNMAVDPESFLDVYPEVSITPAEKETWIQDRRGAIVGDVLARKLGVNVGSKITLRGTIFPGDWEFNIDGIYKATQKSIDRSSLFFHWAYMNESLPDRRKDQVGWITSRVGDSAQSANITAAIDKIFDEKDVQTSTMSERAMNTSFMAMFSSILTVLDIVSIVIMVIMMLILGNTIAMGVRERTREYGVLRALGFSQGHVRVFVIGEALTVGALSGALGLLLSFLLIDFVVGRVLEENMGAWFPYFRVDATTALVAVVLSVLVGALSSIIPAHQASKLAIIDSLRRVG
jgi:putative ABC transport system permease protein